MGQPPSSWRLAIDFGTTNTAAAVEHNGQVHTLPLTPESHTMRSAVLVMDGQIKTGTAAARGGAVHPAGFEPTPKRRLDEEHIVLDGGMRQPVQLVAAVLRKVFEHALADADRVLPEEVVLTYPQAWHAHKVGLLRAAAEQAGIPGERLRVVSEPVATAWYYATIDPLPAGAHLAVLDLGGGTCDVALLRFVTEGGSGQFEVLDSAGIDPLGGYDFDARLETWVKDHVRNDRRSDLLDALAEPRQVRARVTLREDVRATKESLSENQSETIGVIVVDHEWVGTVTRAEYEQLIATDIERAVSLVRTVLERGLPAGVEIDKLYLTGGSSVTPLLQRRLEQLLPGRLGTRGDRKQVTALGALHTPRNAPAPVARQQEPQGPTEPQAPTEPHAEKRHAPTVPPPAPPGPVPYRSDLPVREEDLPALTPPPTSRLDDLHSAPPDQHVKEQTSAAPGRSRRSKPTAKLDTERVVPLDEPTLAAVHQWLAVRGAHRSLPHPRQLRDADFLFVTGGHRMAAARIRRGLLDAVTASGLTGVDGTPLTVTPHQLRHTYATELINAGMSLQSLMMLLGHVTPEMTLRYARLANSSLRTAYDDALARVHATTALPLVIDSRPPLPDPGQWLQAEAIKTRLSGGYCTRPTAAGACPYANICEQCDNFTTSTALLPVLTAQLRDEQTLRGDAHQRGWTSEAKRHELAPHPFLGAAGQPTA